MANSLISASTASTRGSRRCSDWILPAIFITTTTIRHWTAPRQNAQLGFTYQKSRRLVFDLQRNSRDQSLNYGAPGIYGVSGGPTSVVEPAHCAVVRWALHIYLCPVERGHDVHWSRGARRTPRSGARGCWFGGRHPGWPEPTGITVMPPSNTAYRGLRNRLDSSTNTFTSNFRPATAARAATSRRRFEQMLWVLTESSSIHAGAFRDKRDQLCSRVALSSVIAAYWAPRSVFSGLTEPTFTPAGRRCFRAG